jgi:subtilisin family serine protease
VDSIIVRARRGAGIARLRDDLSAKGLTLGAHIPHTSLYAVRTDALGAAAAIRILKGDTRLVGAMPNFARHAFATPNDPYFALAEPYFTTIRLPQAWDLGRGSSRSIIAVLDTGVTAVDDLSTQVLPGHNFVAGGVDAHDDSIIGHGTLVAGIAAATTDNGIGIAGAAWGASVLPVKVLDARGIGTDLEVAAGIVWAVDHGANVVNLSLGGPGPGQVLCDAVTYADSHGVLVVASAGNTATAAPNYPAACSGALAVSATDTNGDFASFSSFGPWVGLAAPGVRVVSTRNDNSYGAESGTSLSAPMVSAVAALVLAQHPDWDPSLAAAQLEQTAQDRGPAGDDPFYGHGLLDADAALGGPAQPATIPTGDGLEPNDAALDATALTRSARATISPEGDVDWYVANIRRPCVLTFRVDGPAYNQFAGPNFRPVLQIYDESLDQLATHDDASTGRVRIAARVPAGTYYLRVANRGGSRSPGTYSVSVKAARLHHVFRPSLG